MAKKKTSVVWIWRDCVGDYCVNTKRPIWKNEAWQGHLMSYFCYKKFQRLFPFFTMPENSLGRIPNNKKTLTFEIIETK